mmetsp:Transcript_141688/g.395024  ORF Transcript_141688/g.395024 Transcript_141688/m.395024 type:complete len:309 (+) Transcript_141688:485-1411(+)
MCCGPSKSSSKGSAHRVAVPLGGVLLLLIKLRPRWQANPNDVHLRRLAEPQGALFQRATEHAHPGRVDQAAQVQSVAHWRVDVGLHHLEGLEVRRSQENLVLAEMAVANRLISGIAEACESQHCNVPVRAAAGKMAARVEGAPARHARDCHVPTMRLQGALRRHLVGRVEGRDGSGHVAAIDLDSSGASVAGGPVGTLHASLCRAHKDRRSQQGPPLRVRFVVKVLCHFRRLQLPPVRDVRVERLESPELPAQAWRAQPGVDVLHLRAALAQARPSRPRPPVVLSMELRRRSRPWARAHSQRAHRKGC